MDRKYAQDLEPSDQDIRIPSLEKSLKDIELGADGRDRTTITREWALPPTLTAEIPYRQASMTSSAVSQDAHNRPAPEPAPSFTALSLPSTVTRPPGSDVGFRTPFACISMHMTDRIRLLRFPASINQEIIEIVRKAWLRGIHAPRDYGQSLEIKMKGNPWSPHAWGDSRVEARRLMAQLLDGLYQRGWIIKVSVDIGHVDSMFFRYQQPAPPRCTWMSISFHHSDKLRIVDAPHDFGLILADALGANVEGCQVKGTVFEIKLHGSPWRAVGTKTVQTRVILLTMMDVLEQRGFSLYAPINHNSRRSKDPSEAEADTWYCNRPLDWKAGQFVYHG